MLMLRGQAVGTLSTRTTVRTFEKGVLIIIIFPRFLLVTRPQTEVLANLSDLSWLHPWKF